MILLPRYKDIKEFEQIGEYEIPIPKPPDINKMDGKWFAKQDQKFQRVQAPKNLKVLPQREQEDFIHEEYRKRKEGYWFFNNGKPTYITGLHYFFLNYWHTQDIRLPKYVESQRKLHYVWDYVCHDPTSYGMFVIKPRRVRATEFALCMLYETATRIKSAREIMFHLSLEENEKNFKRIVIGHKHMEWYMKAMTSGSDMYKQPKINFEKPSERITKKGVSKEFDIFKDDNDELLQMFSSIECLPTVEGKGDGDKYKRIYFDEFGKVDKIDIIRHHQILKPTMHEDNGMKILGKALYTSTMEDKDEENPYTLDISGQMWDNSNPKERMPDGKTVSGMYRLFLPATWATDTDEYGFHKEEEYLSLRAKKIEYFIQNGLHKELISLKRKEPMEVEDALTPVARNTIIDNREDLERRIYQLQNRLDYNSNSFDKFSRPIQNKEVRGNFLWKDGVKFGQVVWETSPENGRWTRSQDCIAPCSFRVDRGQKIPNNYIEYCMGVDPYDTITEQTLGKRSNGAAVVFRKFDSSQEPAQAFLENELIVGEMLTNQPVCVYDYRHVNPEDFFDDILKTAFYYGCDALVEKNRGSWLKGYFERNGYGSYLQYASHEISTASDRKESGVTSSTKTIIQYIDLMKIYYAKFMDCQHHLEILKQLLTFTNEKKSRTKSDVAVAMGLALLASKKEYRHKSVEEKNIVWYNTYEI